jgi:hypothetical protein
MPVKLGIQRDWHMGRVQCDGIHLQPGDAVLVQLLDCQSFMDDPVHPSHRHLRGLCVDPGTV